MNEFLASLCDPTASANDVLAINRAAERCTRMVLTGEIDWTRACRFAAIASLHDNTPSVVNALLDAYEDGMSAVRYKLPQL